ncbi:MAG: hypothetical protein II720_05140 [Bacteroidales bacterium]|nr:hypothetical protein [Bacteroidales bacterium]
MKDIIIKGSSIRRELIIYALCIVVMVGVNAGAIIAFDRPWTELFTQVGYTLTGALVLYLAAGLVRLLILLIIKLIKKNK